MAAFDVNTDALIDLTVKLGRLHRSALPVAVRGTLNDAAFEAKKWIPRTASRKFTTRNKSFFRAFSSVNKAGGFDINSMQAEVGINPGKGTKTAEGLAKQEKGGSIQGRKLIPHDKGRVGGSHAKKLRAKHKFSNINIADKQRGRAGVNYLLIRKGSKGTVFEVRKTGSGRKLTPVYTYRNTRNSRVQKTPFVAPASMIARNKIGDFYFKQAKRRFERALKR